MSVKADLIAARKLIEKPENWMQYDYVRDRNGVTSYCLVGAIHQVSTSSWSAEGAVRRIANRCLESFNDTHTHEEVLELLDRAIAAQTEG